MSTDYSGCLGTGGEGNGNLLQYSSLENPMDGGAWKATVHGVAKSWTRLSDFTFLGTGVVIVRRSRMKELERTQKAFGKDEYIQYYYGVNVCISPKFMCRSP